MLKINEFPLGLPALVKRRRFAHGSKLTQSDPAILREQYEKDLHRYLGGARHKRERNTHNDSHDE